VVDEIDYCRAAVVSKHPVARSDGGIVDQIEGKGREGSTKR